MEGGTDDDLQDDGNKEESVLPPLTNHQIYGMEVCIGDRIRQIGGSMSVRRSNAGSQSRRIP
jgi:hypothetical protein